MKKLKGFNSKGVERVEVVHYTCIFSYVKARIVVLFRFT